MAKVIVALLVAAIVAYVARRVWIAVLQLRVGAVPEGVDVPEANVAVVLSGVTLMVVFPRGWVPPAAIRYTARLAMPELRCTPPLSPVPV